LDRKLGGPQNRYGHGGEEKNSQPLPASTSSLQLSFQAFFDRMDIQLNPKKNNCSVKTEYVFSVACHW
jgi:hypothetical protein